MMGRKLAARAMTIRVPAMKQCNVLLVSPAFPLNMFWNIKATSRVKGARHPAIPLGLLTVAALLPPEWTCRLVDCNVSRLTDRDLERVLAILPQRGSSTI